jgi:hypothetical protein
LPTSTLSPEKVQRIRELLAQGISRDRVSEMVGVGHGTVDRIKRGEPTKEKMGKATEEVIPERTDEISGDSWNLKINKTNICTEEELIEHCKIDLTIWEVERCIFKHWGMGFVRKAVTTKSETQDVKVMESGVQPLFSVTAILKKKRAVVHARAEIDLLRKEALKYSPKFTGFKPRKPAGSGVAVEHSMVDHHFGGLIWGEETGGEDWDSKIALEAWKDAGASLMQRTDSFKPQMGLLLFGNDQQNADNRGGTTEKLTPQQMDGRYQKVFRTSVESSRWLIDQAVARYGRVHVVIAPGNHDPLASWHLGHTLEVWYHNLPCVTIDNGPQHRKWWEWGKVMVMFEHGDKGKLENYGKVMASQKPEMWGRTKVHEAHTGHVHKKQLIEDMGFIGRSLPTLRPSCSWGSENHHLGSIRAAESFVWSKDEGLIGQANFSILQKSENAA